MADFISQLDGPEMDDALLQVNARTPEAWANGTRAGVPVGPGDETYNNNAQYWAQVAKAAVPAGSTGAVLFSQAQQLSESAKAQARANISAGGSNPNLLDNPWFTINQRGQSSYAGGQYSVDMWRSGGSGNITYDATNHKITAQVDKWIEQRFEDYRWDELVGKRCTFSIIADDILHSQSFVMPSAGTMDICSDNYGYVRVDANSSPKQFSIRIYSGHNISALKLELGSASTLANDVAPNYAEELAKCQRHFKRYLSTGANLPFGYGYGGSATEVRIAIPCPVINPTHIIFSNIDNWRLQYQDGNIRPTAGAISNADGTIAKLMLTVASAVAYRPYILTCGTTGSYIDIYDEIGG